MLFEAPFTGPAVRTGKVLKTVLKKPLFSGATAGAEARRVATMIGDWLTPRGETNRHSAQAGAFTPRATPHFDVDDRFEESDGGTSRGALIAVFERLIRKSLPPQTAQRAVVRVVGARAVPAGGSYMPEGVVPQGGRFSLPGSDQQFLPASMLASTLASFSSAASATVGSMVAGPIDAASATEGSVEESRGGFDLRVSAVVVELGGAENAGEVISFLQEHQHVLRQADRQADEPKEAAWEGGEEAGGDEEGGEEGTESTITKSSCGMGDGNSWTGCKELVGESATSYVGGGGGGGGGRREEEGGGGGGTRGRDGTQL